MSNIDNFPKYKRPKNPTFLKRAQTKCDKINTHTYTHSIQTAGKQNKQ